MKEKIVKLVFAAIREINEQLPSNQQLQLEEDTVIYGREGTLDSIGVVNLIVAVEQAIEDDLGTTVILADDRAMSQSRSPFRTVETLVKYIESRMSE